jgi:hypothetical protein
MNNLYAPSNPTFRQYYLDEVHQRQLHPVCRPLHCTNSTVKACVRGGLFERFFCGFNNHGCVDTFNRLGGVANASNLAKAGVAVSKAVLKDAAKWFNEENVVVPWAAMRDPDKKRLETLELGEQHFPTPHDTKTGTAAPVASAPRRRAPKQMIVIQQPSQPALNTMW